MATDAEAATRRRVIASASRRRRGAAGHKLVARDRRDLGGCAPQLKIRVVALGAGGEWSGQRLIRFACVCARLHSGQTAHRFEAAHPLVARLEAAPPLLVMPSLRFGAAYPLARSGLSARPKRLIRSPKFRAPPAPRLKLWSPRAAEGSNRLPCVGSGSWLQRRTCALPVTIGSNDVWSQGRQV